MNTVTGTPSAQFTLDDESKDFLYSWEMAGAPPYERSVKKPKSNESKLTVEEASKIFENVHGFGPARL